MAEITEAQVLDALKTIGHNGKDLVSAGMISGVAIKSGAVQAALEIDPKLASEMTPIQKAAEAALTAEEEAELRQLAEDEARQLYEEIEAVASPQ